MIKKLENACKGNTGPLKNKNKNTIYYFSFIFCIISSFQKNFTLLFTASYFSTQEYNFSPSLI